MIIAPLICVQCVISPALMNPCTRLSTTKMASCSCSQHLSFNSANVGPIVKLSHKKIKVKTIEFMKENKFITKHATALCSKCVEHIETHIMGVKKAKTDSFDETLQEKLASNEVSSTSIEVITLYVCKQIEEGYLSQLLVEKIACALGTRATSDIKEDAARSSCDLKNNDVLVSLNVSDWLHKRNKIVTNFLFSAAGGTDVINRKKHVLLANSVANLYKASNLAFIAPLSFSSNLIEYYATKSKTVAHINSKQGATGSYSTLKRWIKDCSLKECEPPPSTDIVSFLDNNQVICRNWRVTYGHKTQASVVTTIINILPSETTSIQQEASLSPRQWCFNSDTKLVSALVRQELEKGAESFNKIRNKFLLNRMNKVQCELKQTEQGLADFVDESIQGKDPALQKDNSDPYSWVESMHVEPAPKVIIGEPALENPCSYQSVKTVLKHILDKNGVGNARSWACIGCDGLPFNLGSRLIHENDELKDILLIPGQGHLEMNAVKACYKVLWEVALKELSLMLGFRSPRAQLCCLNCTDHHKAWMILMIYMFGTIDEILRLYILYCSVNSSSPTISGLYTFIASNTSPNFRFMCDFTLNFVLAVYVFRCGVRRNNTHHILAGKSKFMKLFFGLNMTNYQELMLRELKNRVLAPTEVKKFIESTESFTVSGHPSKGEGGDFVLEAINRKTKRWLPSGVPTAQHWLEVCRNLNILDKIRDNTMHELDIPGDELTVYQRDVTKETMHWRAKLRTTHYMEAHSDNSAHTSIAGKPLDRDLIFFENKCSKNLNIYLDNYAQGNALNKRIALEPVFCTDLERSKYFSIEKKTKAQIEIIIQQMLVEIKNAGDGDEAVVLGDQWAKVKVMTKKDMLQFYGEVVAALENAVRDESVDDTSSGDEHGDI